MKRDTIVFLLVLILLFSGFYPQKSEGQTLGQRIEAGREYLEGVIRPQLTTFTEADHYLGDITFYKRMHVEYMVIHLDDGITDKTLEVSSHDFLWLNYRTLLNFPFGTPIRFYHREIALSDINDSIQLADYLIPVIINRDTD